MNTAEVSDRCLRIREGSSEPARLEVISSAHFQCFRDNMKRNTETPGWFRYSYRVVLF